MAALTTETALTNTWVQVADDGAAYAINNNGNSDVFLFWKATQPATTDVGWKIKPGNGVNDSVALQGDVWARCPSGVGSVAVNV